jgi:hypothetical protein
LRLQSFGERWPGGLGGKHIVAQNANDKDGCTGADFVAVDESGFHDASAVEESAIAAVEIEEAAAFLAEIDGEVETGHSFVVSEGAVGFRVASNAQGLTCG